MNNNIVNIQNPIPILQQPKGQIISNSLIPNKQQELEYVTTDIEELEKMNKEKKNAQKNGIKYQSFESIHSKISESIIGISTELFEKPQNDTWIKHIVNIFLKDERYSYIGLLLIIIAIISYTTRYTKY